MAAEEIDCSTAFYEKRLACRTLAEEARERRRYEVQASGSDS